MDLKTIKSSLKTAVSGQGSLIDRGLGIMIAVIVIGNVSIPVVQDVIDTTNLSGTAGTILGYVPLALALSLFIAAISMIRR